MKKPFFQNTALVLALLTSIAIASTEVPIWISVFSFVMIAWKYLHEKFNLPKLSKKITPVFGVLIFAIVYIQYKSILGQEESTTLLLGLVAISILNYETERDTLFLVLLGFLIVVLKAVFSLSFIWTIPALFSFFALWYSLIHNSKINRIRYLFEITLRSIPALIVLFIFFPRLIIFQTKQANRVIVQSGFNEELNPGQFSEIALQNQTVFRAEFINTSMNTEELYWRGAILNISKGFVWHKGLVERATLNSQNNVEGSLHYKVILEPLNLKNVFVLDSPVQVISSSSPITELSYSTFELGELANQQVQFEATSSLILNQNKINDPTDSQKYLTYPNLPPKAQKLVNEIKSKNPTLIGRLKALKIFYQKKGFIYTLKPELYGNNLDEFLFERKKGFCEHFAASFGTLARALEIPSRVVIGYQGGSYNALGQFWKISQKDAHAWVEVGLNGRWQREDPTALVTPLRISLGGENYFALSEDDQILFSQNPKGLQKDSMSSVFNQLRSFFENLNYYWTLLLLNYDLQAQLEFLKKFQGSGAVGIFFISLFFVFLIYQIRKSKRQKNISHELSIFLSQIENWAESKKIHVTTQTTPYQVFQQISKRYPQLSEVMNEVSEQYDLVVYQEKKLKVSLKNLKKKWKSTLQELD